MKIAPHDPISQHEELREGIHQPTTGAEQLRISHAGRSCSGPVRGLHENLQCCDTALTPLRANIARRIPHHPQQQEHKPSFRIM